MEFNIQDYEINRLTDVVHECQDEILWLQDGAKKFGRENTDEIKALVEKLNSANTAKYNIIDARAIHEERLSERSYRNAGDEAVLEGYRKRLEKAEKSEKVVEYFGMLANAK